jgi:hypothetical protein
MWFVEKIVMRLNIDIASHHFNETLVKRIKPMEKIGLLSKILNINVFY